MNINTDDPDDEPTEEQLAAHELQQLLQDLNADFENACQERHEQSDNPIEFFADDVISNMMETLVDIANHARYQYVKLAILQQQLEQDARIVGHAGLTQGSEDIQIGWPKDARSGERGPNWGGSLDVGEQR